jgi:hypothetical protein
MAFFRELAGSATYCRDPAGGRLHDYVRVIAEPLVGEPIRSPDRRF